MEYLIATYWSWFVVALLVGGAVGYWSSWWLASTGGTSSLLRWGAAAFAAGLVVAVFHWLPQRAGLYLETLLLLWFWYALGGFAADWLRGARSRTDLAITAGAPNAQFAGAGIDHIAAAKVAAAAPAAVAGDAEDARSAAAAKAAQEARAAAAAKAAEDARLAAAAKAAEEARAVADAMEAEDARQAVTAKAAEEARAAAAAKAAEEAGLAAAAKAAEEARAVAAANKKAEDARLAAAAKAAEEARAAAAAKLAEDQSLAARVSIAEQPRSNAAAKSAADLATTTAATPVVLYPGHRPQGFAPPAAGKADDLKLIKGIGPKNEKSCNALGVYQFHQIADWTPDEAIWVGHHIAFPGRIEREHWIAQAKLLASGGDTDHSKAVKSGALFVDDAADAPLDPAAIEILGHTLPRQAVAVGGEEDHPGRRPYGLAQALGTADDLKRIRGIGPQNEGKLHGLGIWHFSQIAAWSDENVRWVGSYLAFSGRIDREKWIDQARALAIGQETEFSRRVAAGKVATSKDNGAFGREMS
jgi:predicted flap endonuclease-1-like 5' DNA nuclease